MSDKLTDYRLPSYLYEGDPVYGTDDVLYGNAADGDDALSTDTLVADMHYGDVTIADDTVITTDGYKFFARKVTVAAGKTLTIRSNGGAGGNGAAEVTPGTPALGGSAGSATGAGSTAAGQAGVVGVAGKAGRTDAGIGGTGNQGTEGVTSNIITGAGKSGGWSEQGLPNSGEGGCTGYYTSLVPDIRDASDGTVVVPDETGYAAMLIGDGVVSPAWLYPYTAPAGGVGGGAGCNQGFGVGRSGGGGGAGGSGASGGVVVVGIKEVIGTVVIEAIGGDGGDGGDGAASSGWLAEVGGGGGGAGGNGGNGGVAFVAIGFASEAVNVNVSGGDGGDGGDGAINIGTGGYPGSGGPKGLGGYPGRVENITNGNTVTLVVTEDSGTDGNDGESPDQVLIKPTAAGTMKLYSLMVGEVLNGETLIFTFANTEVLTFEFRTSGSPTAGRIPIDVSGWTPGGNDGMVCQYITTSINNNSWYLTSTNVFDLPPNEADAWSCQIQGSTLSALSTITGTAITNEYFSVS